ncbi:MAG: glycosyltransferase involved in cell wall biosynthesis [Arcticibacterium sp.]|jgi:glycosyltransferase involved in cell wall biosynthesis
MNYLLVDLNIQLNGHKLGFVQETLNWLNRYAKNSGHHFHFLVNHELYTPSSQHISVHYLEEDLQAKLQETRPLVRYRTQWKYIKVKANELEVSQLILMEFDIYQIAIGNVSKMNFDINGIWFRPFYRQKVINSSLLEKLKFGIAKMRKQVTYKLALRNHNLKQVFVLNDQKTVNELNLKYNPKLRYLPDPVMPSELSGDIDIRSKYDIGVEKKIFLIFGYIDDRKNVPNILRALNKLPRAYQLKISLLLFGKVANNYSPILRDSILENESEVQIIENNEFVSNDEMGALFQSSNLVLRMNINYFASSGIIGLAAKYNKPSLVSNYGVVADLTKAYVLGKEVDPLAIMALSSHFKDFIDNPEDWKINGSSYCEKHSMSKFVTTLLSLA